MTFPLVDVDFSMMNAQINRFEFLDTGIDLLIDTALQLQREGALFRVERNPDGPGWRLSVLDLEARHRCDHDWETMPDGTVVCFVCDHKFTED